MIMNQALLIFPLTRGKERSRNPQECVPSKHPSIHTSYIQATHSCQAIFCLTKQRNETKRNDKLPSERTNTSIYYERRNQHRSVGAKSTATITQHLFFFLGHSQWTCLHCQCGRYVWNWRRRIPGFAYQRTNLGQVSNTPDTQRMGL